MHKEIGRFRLVLVAILSFLFSGILCFSGNDTHATTSTLTLSITDSLSVDLFATSSTGTFATSDTTTPNIFVKTNNGTGYTLGIKASSSSANNNRLINTTDNTKYFSSISPSNFPSGISESDYSNDTYASTNNLNNTWGYRPSKLNSVNNSNYLPAPTDATNPIILDQTTTANPSTNNEYNIAIGARANNTTAPGSYANTFIITAVANPSKYSITYNKNTTDTVTNMPANVSNQDTYGDTVNIDTTVPVRNGYNFKGWCSVQLPDDSDSTACTNAGGTTYDPDGGGTDLTWTIDQTAATNSLNLYAMWEVAGPDPDPDPDPTCDTPVPGVTYMQDLNSSNTATVMNNMAENTQYYLRDSRDAEPYCVAKIQGALWMTQNLRITGTVPAEGSNFTGADVNISECDLDRTVGECTGASDRYSYDIPMTHDSGNTTNGVWYNYAAASAKTIVGSSNPTIDTENICPENWTLPSYDTTKPAGSINSLEESDSPTITAFTPVAGGYYSDGSPYGTSRGYWWSTVANYNYVRYNLSWNGSSLSTNSSYRDIGLYIRCMRAS